MSTITQNPPLLILPKFKLEVRNIAFIWWPTYAPCIWVFIFFSFFVFIYCTGIFWVNL